MTAILEIADVVRTPQLLLGIAARFGGVLER
jgi:hypothetical protein